MLIRNRLIILAAVIVLVILGLVLDDSRVHFLSLVLIMALFATSLNVEVGYAGMLPLGQSMFLGLGAYSFGLLILKAGFSFPLAFFTAILICIVLNIIIGYLCLRGETMTFALLHFAFNIQFYTLVYKWTGFTGGNFGISGIPMPDIFDNERAVFFFILAVVIICYIILRMIMNSPFGKVILGLRENEQRLCFLGINTRGFKLSVFVITGIFTGIAGILMATLSKAIFPTYFDPLLSAQAITMCILGGMNTFMGPSLGALVITTISAELSGYFSQWQGVLGAIMMACVLIFRGGILRKVKNKIKGSRKGIVT